MLKISVIICTHNPKKNFLSRTLEALSLQTLPKEEWELLLIDNASIEVLEETWDLSWHPEGRHIRENELGLTAARLRGITEARAELLIFVDDDNLLAPDYLENALTISISHPHLGAWGGNLIPEYELEPPEWARPQLGMLAIRIVDKDVWSNIPDWSAGTCPAGAGMCVRSSVALEYSRYCRDDPKRKGLDRKGKSLISCGDLDMAFTACDLGMGTGLFRGLSLIHIIPKGRLDLNYLLRLCEANGVSSVILKSFRENMNDWLCPQKTKLRVKIRKLIKIFLRSFSDTGRKQNMFDAAFQRGLIAGVSLLKDQNYSFHDPSELS